MGRTILKRRFSISLRLAGLGLAAVTAASFAPQGALYVDLLEHFRIQYAWIGAGLALALALIGAWRTAAAALAAAVVNLWILWPFLGWDAGARAAAGGERIKLVWSNVYYWNDDVDALAAFLRAEQPDLIVMAELTPALLSRLEPLRADYPHTLECVRLYYCQLGVLSRRPFTSMELRHDAKASRRLLRIGIDVGGTPLTLYATHLTSPMSGGRRTLQDEQIGDVARFIAAEPGPLVLVGDLNATPWSRPMARFREGARPVGAAAQAVPLDASNLTEGPGLVPSWPAAAPGPLFRIPIDHVMARAGAHVASRTTGPVVGSDHLPIIAEIAVGPISTR
jgi:endonuclease/exonuclease/phosphatase (EEP) superfamily protein YafD